LPAGVVFSWCLLETDPADAARKDDEKDDRRKYEARHEKS
jgi:hypothetical protein